MSLVRIFIGTQLHSISFGDIFETLLQCLFLLDIVSKIHTNFEAGQIAVFAPLESSELQTEEYPI